MAVTRINEIAKGRDGEGRRDGTVQYKRVLRVFCDDPYDNSAVVRAAVSAEAGCTPTDAYPGDASAFPIKYSEVQEHERLIWIAEIEYSNELANPLTEPAELSTGGQAVSVVMVVDANGDAVLNTAGFPIIDPPVERDRSRGHINFSKNVAVPPAWVYTLNDTVNLATFSIWGGVIVVAAETAKLKEPPEISGPHEQNGITYYTVKGTIEVDREGWKARVLNAGFDEKDPSTPTERRKILIDDQTEPSQPVPLDASGYRLVNPTPATVVILEFDRYLPVDWTSLVALLT